MRPTSRPAVHPLLRKALSTSKILSAERERELLVRYHADQDKTAMDELVRSHMPIIFRAAGRSARNPGIDIDDLVQTATEGLLIAIDRWSFEKSDASGAHQANEVTFNSLQGSRHRTGRIARLAARTGNMVRLRRLWADWRPRRAAA